MNMSGGSSRSLTVVDAESARTPKKKQASVKKTASKPVVTSPAKVAKKQKAQKPAPKKKTVAKKAKATAKPAAKEKKTFKKSSPKAAKPKTQKTAAQPKAKAATFGTNKSLSELKRDPLGHLLVETKLREAGFRGIVTSEKSLLDAYSTDESIFSIRPQLVLIPEDAHDVQIAASVIGSETKLFSSLSLTPRSAGTGLSGGSLTDSIVIDVSQQFKNIGEVKKTKGKITITTQPGANFAEVEKVLKGHGAYLPFAPASRDICSIGGAVANNAAGPDSLKHGHAADWVESLDVVLSDGRSYTVTPLTYKEFKTLLKKDNHYAKIAKEIFEIIEKNEKAIQAAKPHTKKNTAGYPLWSVISGSVASFKKGKGTFDLTRLIAGSQGTIGIITGMVMRAEPIPKETTLIMLPVFDLDAAGHAIIEALALNPINIEVFDAISFNLALKNPEFFKKRIPGLGFYKVMYTLYTTYHVRYRRKIPEFTILVTLPEAVETPERKDEIVKGFRDAGCNVVRFVKTPEEKEMWWQVRRASYTLSKMQDKTKRPAAFLEDMIVPPENFFKFFADIQKLFAKYDVKAAVHGHGGDGHFHFYPLMDFSNPKTPNLIEAMSEEFFNAAIRHGGSICGEHNDGIIRTPHLSKVFSKPILELFKRVEHICDPDDIFNPGKKVNPRYDIKDSIRKTN